MESKKVFGNYMMQKRKEIGLTQKGFADKLFVTESAVSKWERGISYPDISLIKEICEILGVSEHELLSASEDIQTRNNERLANQYLKLIARLKRAQIVLYALTLITCLICNVAVNHTLSWFFIVFASLLLSASLTLLPILVTRQRWLFTLLGFTVSLLLLLFVCAIYSGGSWFFMAGISILFGMCVVFLPFILPTICLPNDLLHHKALICMAADTCLLFGIIITSYLYTKGSFSLLQAFLLALFWLVIPWSIMLIIRYLPVNSFFKTAACLGAADIIFFLSEGITDMILEGRLMSHRYEFNLLYWNLDTLDGNLRIIIALTLLGLAVIFAVAGIFTAMRKSKLPNNSN